MFEIQNHNCNSNIHCDSTFEKIHIFPEQIISLESLVKGFIEDQGQCLLTTNLIVRTYARHINNDGLFCKTLSVVGVMVGL